MKDLMEISYNQKIKFASFDITNMYSNIKTKKLSQIISLMCDQKNISKKFNTELTKLSRVLLKQNYFQFHDTIYKQKEGLAMGAPTSSIFSEIYLQYI
jgi:hypothetical protein